MNLHNPCCLLRSQLEKKNGGSSYDAALVTRSRFKEKDDGHKDQGRFESRGKKNASVGMMEKRSYEKV